MAALAIDLGLATDAMAPAAREVPIGEFFASPFGLRVAFELFLYSAAAGLFVVPIFAAIQAWAGEDRRARVVGAVNALTYIMMVAGSLATMALLQIARLAEPMALVVLGVANILAALLLFRRLPANFLAFFLRTLWRVMFRLEVKGIEHLPRPGERAIVAVNHVSLLDAPILFSLMQAPPLFAIDHGIGQRWSLLKLAGVRPVDPTRPLTARALIRATRAGHALAIFPEGRVALTPPRMKAYEAAALMIDKSEAPVTPVRLVGPERSLFSLLDPKQVGRRLFPKITVTILPPRPLADRGLLTRPGSAKGRRRRALRSDVGPRVRDGGHSPDAACGV